MYRLYGKIARVWSVVFAAVGVFLLVIPGAFGEGLTRLAGTQGLDGAIEIRGDDLGYVLSLSLMGTLVLLAHLSASAPAEPRPYWVLLTAKGCSTAGFAYLAIAAAPAWWICAAADGFVALSLWAARRRDRPTFVTRLLAWIGAPGDRIPAYLAQVSRQVRRYRLAARWCYPLVLWCLDFWAPLLLLGTWRRGSELEDKNLDFLLRRLRSHHWVSVRLAALFALLPPIESVTLERPPLRAPHPLEGRLDAHAVRPPEFVDVAVIGSGAGGAPVAWSLACKGFRVAVIEKGDLVRPDAALRIVEKHYVARGMLMAVDSKNTLVMAGQAVGGTTTINSGTCLRPHRECLQEWDNVLGTAFARGELNPWLDLAEEKLGVTVPPRELLSRSAMLFENGLRTLGLAGAYVLPRSAPTCQGSGRCCFGCPTGAKRSTDLAFLPEAVDAGAWILSRSRACGIRQGTDHVSVTVENRQGRHELRCRHLVIAAGAIFTPGLLRRNRVGEYWKEAGRRLKIHPATKVFAYFPRLNHGEGGIPQGLGYRPPELPRVTLEGIHTPRGVAAPMLAMVSPDLRWWLDRYDHLASFGVMIRDRQTGQVFEVGGRPWIRYRLDEEDARDLGAGIRLMAEAFFAAGARRLLLPTIRMNSELRSLVEARRLEARAFTPDHLLVAGFHPQGTAGMGRVVDANLRVIGTDRIWVCDASVFPESPGVNPQVTIMALSLRLGDHLASLMEA
ncbi:MAG: GMC family oxidoreductase N-terminal domain-containing protein [Planctomycetes bacterium]|nr:GMC family oxidoreductase N-terminal domain-containing protein [Planctomycetota bacterium]